jgi:hypothetical protein
MKTNPAQCYIVVDDHDKALDFCRDARCLGVRDDVNLEAMLW